MMETMGLDRIIDGLENRACHVMAADRGPTWENDLLQVREALLQVRERLLRKLEPVQDASHAKFVQGLLDRLMHVDGILDLLLAAYADHRGEALPLPKAAS